MDLIIDKDIDYIIPSCNELNILVKKNVSANIIEKNDIDRLINITLEEDSNLSYISIDVSTNTKKNITLNRSSSLNMISSSFKGGNKEINAYLNEEDASFNLKQIIMMKDELDNEITNVYHKASNTNSLIENYITSNKANVNVDVIGKIEKGMNNSNCVQKSRGIIISDNANIKIKPVLLIDEYDVSANHGCAIGKIDDEGLYYLMSRGISKKEAEMLIIKGFLSPILNKLTNEDIKNELVNLQDEKL